jgi:hypothetical protein
VSWPGLPTRASPLAVEVDGAAFTFAPETARRRGAASATRSTWLDRQSFSDLAGHAHRDRSPRRAAGIRHGNAEFNDWDIVLRARSTAGRFTSRRDHVPRPTEGR